MAQATMSGKQTVLKDQRGRISFPAGFRAAIGEFLYVSPDPTNRGYLVVRSEEGFNKEIERVEQAERELSTATSPDGVEEDVADARRFFTGQTFKIAPDKNGRITIDKSLLNYAELGDRVTVVGVGSYAEIWDEEKLERTTAERMAARARRRAQLDAERQSRIAGEKDKA